MTRTVKADTGRLVAAWDMAAFGNLPASPHFSLESFSWRDEQMKDSTARNGEVRRLTKIATELDLTADEVRIALDINHDRTNNGGIAEVVEIAIEGGDDPEWIDERIRDAAEEKRIDAGK